ncbi:MAG: hypothetical protein ACYTGQ_15290, partial [Planctomycetota bacterium]
LLDLVFKPGIEVRVLGGSLEQSRKMHGHLRWMLDREGLADLLEGGLTQRGARLKNGSAVELLAQSQTSVRGQRVQKLRCDEVELFDRDVWEAAQFVTRSAVCGGVEVRGGVEVLSTAHRPFGLMNELIAAATGECGDRGWSLFRWNALDVMGRCAPATPCAGCSIEEVCGGRAKSWRGFLPAEDVLSQRGRSSKGAFEAEMLCRRPSRRDAVYPMFDPAVHVLTEEPAGGDDACWVGGMDFGVRSPFVMLWAQAQRGVGWDGRRRDRVVVFDEYVQPDVSMVDHLEAMSRRGWPVVRWAGVDPAGHQRERVTGQSVIGVLREAGWRVRARKTRLGDGVETVRRWLEERVVLGDGETEAPRLVIHPRCARLIESMVCYHFDAEAPRDSRPVKDGYDHAADALRYMLVNVGVMGGVTVTDY